MADTTSGHEDAAAPPSFGLSLRARLGMPPPPSTLSRGLPQAGAADAAPTRSAGAGAGAAPHPFPACVREEIRERESDEG